MGRSPGEAWRDAVSISSLPFDLMEGVFCALFIHECFIHGCLCHRTGSAAPGQGGCAASRCCRCFPNKDVLRGAEEPSPALLSSHRAEQPRHSPGLWGLGLTAPGHRELSEHGQGQCRAQTISFCPHNPSPAVPQLPGQGRAEDAAANLSPQLLQLPSPLWQMTAGTHSIKVAGAGFSEDGNRRCRIIWKHFVRF